MGISTTTAYAFGTGTISTAVVALTDLTGLTAADVDAADRVRITVAANPIRYRYDGGDPDATTGHYLAANEETEIVGGANIANLKFIRTGADAVLSVTLEAF
jgi:hypothetical protein